MIYERGRVVAVKQNSVWVETINQSACLKCQVRKGCGHSLLARLGGRQHRLEVSVSEEEIQRLVEGDEVTIGMDSSAVVRVSLLAYLLPLMGALIAAILMDGQGTTDFVVALAAVAGFCAGAVFVRFFSRWYQHDPRYQPVLVH